MNANRIQPTGTNRFLSQLYRSAVGLRNIAYDKGIIKSERVAAPVISVGNVTVGGSGKSPFASFMCEGLLALGRRPVILSRGYGGLIAGPHRVRETDAVSDVGDEPLMHQAHFADRVPVVIARQRVAGARFIVSQGLGDTIVLDDGFQHRRLERAADIVLIDPSSERTREAFAQKLLLPAGVLRESPKSALRRATCLVVVERGAAGAVHTDFAKQLAASCPIFRVRIEPAGVIDIFTRKTAPAESLRKRKINLFSAIAHPEQFVSMVRDMGVETGRALTLPDHQTITADAWRSFAAHEVVLTTEKDAVKIRGYLRGPGEAFALSLACCFQEERDRTQFWNLIQERIRFA